MGLLNAKRRQDAVPKILFLGTAAGPVEVVPKLFNLIPTEILFLLVRRLLLRLLFLAA